MATLEHLAATDKLLKHEADLYAHQLPLRTAYFAPEFDAWLDELWKIELRRGRDLAPFEQAEQALYDVVIGRPMAFGVDYRKLEPHEEHVWELKTLDVRVFG